jgi:hypothetical protein
MPPAPGKQKELWTAISQRVAYHLPFEPEVWMLAEQNKRSEYDPEEEEPSAGHFPDNKDASQEDVG